MRNMPKTSDMAFSVNDTSSYGHTAQLALSCNSFPCPYFVVFVSTAWQPISSISMIKLYIWSLRILLNSTTNSNGGWPTKTDILIKCVGRRVAGYWRVVATPCTY